MVDSDGSLPAHTRPGQSPGGGGGERSGFWASGAAGPPRWAAVPYRGESLRWVAMEDPIPAALFE